MYQLLFFCSGYSYKRETERHREREREREREGEREGEGETRERTEREQRENREKSRVESTFLGLVNSKNKAAIYLYEKHHGGNELGKKDQEFIF